MICKERHSLQLLLYHVLEDLENGSIRFNKSLQVMAFADDLDIIGKSQREVKGAFACLEAVAKKMGLTTNIKLSIWKSPAHGQTKTHYILMTLEAIEQFKYLEPLVTTNSRLKLEIPE